MSSNPSEGIYNADEARAAVLRATEALTSMLTSWFLTVDQAKIDQRYEELQALVAKTNKSFYLTLRGEAKPLTINYALHAKLKQILKDKNPNNLTPTELQPTQRLQLIMALTDIAQQAEVGYAIYDEIASELKQLIQLVEQDINQS